MHELHIAGHRVQAIRRVGHPMLHSIRSTRTVCIARVFLGMPLDMAPRMALDTATGVGMVPDIGLGREAYPYPAAFPNSRVEVRSLSKFGYRRWIFHHGDSRKEAGKGHDQSLQ